MDQAKSVPRRRPDRVRDPGLCSVARTYVVDTAIAKVRGLGAWRAEPAFLDCPYIWDEESALCDERVPRPGHRVRAHLYLRLLTGPRPESIIDQVIDVWPHPN